HDDFRDVLDGMTNPGALSARGKNIFDVLAIQARAPEKFDLPEFLRSQWPGVRDDLFNPALKPAEGPEVLPAATVEKALTNRFTAAVFEFERDKDDALARGLRRPGELVREIIGCQGLMARYVELALPEFQSDPELQALLVGDEAAWGGSAVM